jgi:cytoskeletal protein CcmA (bactofilin family)
MLEKKAEGKLDTVIGRNTRIIGEIKTEGSLRVDGRGEGNLTVSDTLISGQGSFVKGDVRCKNAVLGGRIEGNVFAGGVVEMQSGSSLLGDITCKGVVIQPNVFFEGRCQMSDRKEGKQA